MPVSAYFEKNTDHGGGGADLCLCLGEAQNGDQIPGVIHSITQAAVLAETAAELNIDSVIDVKLAIFGSCKARVVMATDGAFLCQFLEPIGEISGKLQALNDVIGNEILSGAPTIDPEVETMGSRIQRLRYQRGLSQTEVAARMGVSNPAVSAWEQDKARPSASRLIALAEILGIRSDELLAGRQGSDGLSDIVARCRQMMADAAGTAPEQVRISIDM